IFLLFHSSQLFDDVSPDIAHPYFAALTHLFDHLNEFFSSFLRQPRYGDAYNLSIVRRCHPQLGLQNRLFYLTNYGMIPRLNNDKSALRYREGGYLVEGAGGSVIIHTDVIQKGQRGPAGAYLSQILLQSGNRLFHLHFTFFDDLRFHKIPNYSTSLPSPPRLFSAY